MRERAEKATPSAEPLPGGWAGFGTDATPMGNSMLFGGPAKDGYRTGTVLWIEEGCDSCTGPTDADVQHIAGWHPAVALAVADWLDGVAKGYETDEDTPECPSCDTGYCRHDKVTYHLACDEPVPCACVKPALSVARAYLGGAR